MVRGHQSCGGRGIDDSLGAALYPPTSPAGLRRLLHAIHSSHQDRLKKDCYFYYLLRDHDAATSRPQANGYDMPTSDEIENQEEAILGRAEAFARRRCIPRTWCVFMDGYWALDHAQWEVSAPLQSIYTLADILLALRQVPLRPLCFRAQLCPPNHQRTRYAGLAPFSRNVPPPLVLPLRFGPAHLAPRTRYQSPLFG